MAYGQIIGAGVIWFVAIWGRLLGAEPFTTWLYFFAWWPLLLFLDGLLACLTSKSLIWQRPKDFLRMALFSVTVWLTFEVFNLWLLNWRYVGVEPIPWLRWPGYALAFATVLPGVLLTAEVLLAGLLCGLWWELWNYPSPVKWIYTLPVLNFGKIFEMPVLGYLGFLPFALECAVMYRFLKLIDQRLSGSARLCFYLAQVAFWLVLFFALDSRTVLSFAQR
ncbi:MAG: hypothetical protein P8X58_11200 [Syntrophobacterales bacterium]